MTRPAVFLDRDGVLVVDAGPAAEPRFPSILHGVADALIRLRAAGYALPVITNQTVVSRGLKTLDQVDATHQSLAARLAASGAHLDAFYVCPHHPSATVPAYRIVCQCRKPKPGLLQQAASDLDIDLSRSYMIGDRMSDIAAGWSAGVTTILVETGKHDRPLIESDDWPDPMPSPDFTCRDLPHAADIILSRRP